MMPSSRKISPSKSLSTPARIFISVDLPAPFAPRMPILAPRYMPRLMFLMSSLPLGVTLRTLPRERMIFTRLRLVRGALLHLARGLVPLVATRLGAAAAAAALARLAFVLLARAHAEVAALRRPQGDRRSRSDRPGDDGTAPSDGRPGGGDAAARRRHDANRPREVSRGAHGSHLID